MPNPENLNAELPAPSAMAVTLKPIKVEMASATAFLCIKGMVLLLGENALNTPEFIG